MADGLNRTTKEYETKINTKKKKVMKISREEEEVGIRRLGGLTANDGWIKWDH